MDISLNKTLITCVQDVVVVQEDGHFISTSVTYLESSRSHFVGVGKLKPGWVPRTVPITTASTNLLSAFESYCPME